MRWFILSWEEKGILWTTSSSGNRFKTILSVSQRSSTIDFNHFAMYIVSGIYGPLAIVDSQEQWNWELILGPQILKNQLLQASHLIARFMNAASHQRVFSNQMIRSNSLPGSLSSHESSDWDLLKTLLEFLSSNEHYIQYSRKEHAYF